MRRVETPSLVDLLVLSLRWLLLIAFVVAAPTGSNLSPESSRLFIISALVASLWNLLFTFLVIFYFRVVALRYITLAGDVLIAGIFYYSSGMLQGNLGWAGLLPILTASLYFQARGTLAVSFAVILLQGSIGLLRQDFVTVAVFLVPILLLYLACGLALGFVARRIFLAISPLPNSKKVSQPEITSMEQTGNQALYKLLSTMNASLNYERVMETALDLGYTALATPKDEDNRLVSCVLLYSITNGKVTELHVGAARRFTPSDLRMTLPGISGLIGKTIDEGSPVLMKAINKDPEVSRIVAIRSCRAAYCIPLSSGLDTYGVLLFAHPDENYFTPQKCEILDVIGNQAVVAMQNAQLYRDLELEKERMMELQEETRKKLARELHDGPTQSIAALAMRVNFARRLMDRDAAAASEELFKIEDLARRTVKEIRHMLFTLRPLVLESEGLIAALESMSESMKGTFDQSVTIDADPQATTNIEPGKQGVIFYIIEEAVNNARKHAQATNVWVRLKPVAEDTVLVEVQDDGVGFNLESLGNGYDHRGSLGMVNMRERTELLNGIIEIESSAENGTHIRVFIPLTESAAHRMRRGA